MQWISIKDRLPDTDRAVIGLCYDGYDNVFKVYYCSIYKGWYFYDTGDYIEDITHWMEIPEFSRDY